MNEYQSMELYHRAFYSHAFDDLLPNESFSLEYSQSPDRKINQSAIGGGDIYFSDSEDIEKWGEGGIEIDKSYLDLILNTEEWEVAADYNLTVNLTYGSAAFSGSVRGFFDEAEIYTGTNFESGGQLYGEGAYFGKRSMGNGKVSQIDNLFNVKTSGRYDYSLYNIYFGKPRKPRIFPELKFDAVYNFDFEQTSSSGALDGEDEKAGNFTSTCSCTRSSFDLLPAGFDIDLSVNRVVITPTKVYIWVNISGSAIYDAFDIMGLQISDTPLTGVVSGTEGPYAQEYIPFGSSTLKFFGEDITVYFASNYYIYADGSEDYFSDFVRSSFISCSCEGTSFDVKKVGGNPT